MPRCALSVEDRLNILDLFARYAWAYDEGDKEAYAGLFTEDGVLADESGSLGVGRQAIMQALQFFLDKRGADVWRHFNDHHLFEGEGNRATIRSYWMVALTRPDGTSGLLGQGSYVTKVVRDGDEWLIARRTFTTVRPR